MSTINKFFFYLKVVKFAKFKEESLYDAFLKNNKLKGLEIELSLISIFFQFESAFLKQ